MQSVTEHLDKAIFTAAFPGKASAILELRASNRALDEVCSDFVELVRLAGRTKKADPALDESIVELRREIEAALLDAATRNSNPKGASS